MRVSEIAALRYEDIINSDGVVRREIQLKAEDTKTNEARVWATT